MARHLRHHSLHLFQPAPAPGVPQTWPGVLGLQAPVELPTIVHKELCGDARREQGTSDTGKWSPDLDQEYTDPDPRRPSARPQSLSR